MARTPLSDFDILGQLHEQLRDPNRNSEVWDSELEREISIVEGRIKRAGGTPPPRPSKAPSRIAPEAVVQPVAANSPPDFENKNPADKPRTLADEYGLDVSKLVPVEGAPKQRTVADEYGIDISKLEKVEAKKTLVDEYGLDASQLVKAEAPGRFAAAVENVKTVLDPFKPLRERVLRPEVVDEVPFRLGAGSARSYAYLRAAMNEMDADHLDKVSNILERIGTDSPPTAQEIANIRGTGIARWHMYLDQALVDPTMKDAFIQELKAYKELALRDRQIHQDVASSTAAEIADRTPKDLNLLEQAVLSAADSAGPTIVSSLLPGGPAVKALAAGVSGGAATFGESYHEAEETAAKKGITLSVEDKARFGAIDAMFEGAGEGFGLKVALKVGSPFFERILRAVGANASQEAVTQVMQDAHKAAVLDPDMTAKEFFYNATVAAIAGGLMGGTFSTSVQLIDKAKGRTSEEQLAGEIEKALKGEQPKPAESPTPAPGPESPATPPVEVVPDANFRQLLKTDPARAAQSVATEQLSKPPYEIAQEMRQSGELTQKQYSQFLQNMAQQALATTVEKHGAEIVKIQQEADPLEQELIAAGKEESDYVPTASEAKDLEIAERIFKAGKDLPADQQVPLILEGLIEHQSPLLHAVYSMFAENVAEPAMSRFPYEKKDFRDAADSNPAKYLYVLAQRQIQGRYPFAGTAADFKDAKTDPIGEGLLWTTEKGTRENLNEGNKKGFGATYVKFKNQDHATKTANVIGAWQKTFAPGSRIRIVDRSSVDFFFKDSTSAARGDGWAVAYNPDDVLIYVDSEALTEAALAEVLAHEFGHYIVKRYKAKLPKSVADAVDKAWAKETKRMMDLKVGDALRQRRGPWGIEYLQQHGENFEVTLGASLQRSFARGYLFGIEEFYAHQMERAYTNDTLGMQAPVKAFFKKAAAQLERFYEKYGKDFAPNKTFADFLRLGVLRERERAARKAALTSAEQMLKDYGLNSLPDEQQMLAKTYLAKALTNIKAPPKLTEDMLKAPPEMQEKAAQAMQRLGLQETSMFVPETDDVPMTAEELTTTLQDAYLPGQGSDSFSMAMNVVDPKTSNQGLPTSKPASRIASALKHYLKYSRFGKHVDTSEYQGHLDRYSWFRKKLHSLEHWAKANPHIEQLQRYLEGVREWHRDRMAWISRADGRLKEWRKLTSNDQKALGRLLLDEAQAGKYFDLNDPAILQKYPLTADARAMHASINQDFIDFLGALEATLVEEAAKRLTKDAIGAAREMQQIRDRFKELKAIPQFPLSRFGRHVVRVTAKGVMKVKGIVYKEGDVVHLEAFDTKLGLYADLDRIKAAYPNAEVKTEEVKEDVGSLMGMPTVILDALKNNKDVNLTDAQKKAIDEYLYQLAPAQSFSRHLAQRRTVEGYTEDVMRAYSDYFFHGTSHLARVKHSSALAEEISATHITAQLITENSAKRTAIANYMQGHFNYIMSPENDLAGLRAMVAVAYLAANIKTATVNLTQVPMVTYPHLAAKYGDGKALRALGKAYTDSMAMYHVAKNLSQREEEAISRWSQGQPMQPGDEKIVTQWSKLELSVRNGLRRALAEGIVDESMAMELAAMSEGSWLTRFKATNKAGYYWRAFSFYSMVPFQAAEKLNRRVTFVAAFRLEKEKGSSDDIAYQAGREAVSASQYEYAKWNRAELLRGKWGAFFMFWQYMLNTMHFAMGGDKGWWRWWLMMLGAAGPMGLPFAQNLMDLATWIGQKLVGPDKRFNAEYEVKKALGQFGDYISVSPDLLTHGISRFGFGPLFWADLSGSISMGRVIPGTGLLSSASNDWNAAVTKGVSEIGGASTSLVMRMLQAAATDDDDELRRWERGMPVTFGQQMISAFRWYNNQAVETRGGADIVKFDTNDPWHLMEIAGKALGFQPRRVSQAREQLALESDFKKFFMLRRTALKGKFDDQLEKGDNEAISAVMDAIHKFNDTAPPSLAITAKELRESRIARLKARTMVEEGLDTQKRYIPLQQSIRDKTY